MKCDKVQELIRDAGELGPEAAEHIARCGRCREEMAFWKAARETLRRAPDVATPPFLHTRIMATVRAERERASKKSLFARFFKPEWLTPTLASLLVALGGGYGFTQALFSPIPDDCVVRWSEQGGRSFELARLEPPAARMADMAPSSAPPATGSDAGYLSDEKAAVSDGIEGSATAVPAPPPVVTGGLDRPASPPAAQEQPLQIASYAPEPRDTFSMGDILSKGEAEADKDRQQGGAKPTEMAMVKPAREEAQWNEERATPMKESKKQEALEPGSVAPALHQSDVARKRDDSALRGQTGTLSKGKAAANSAAPEILCLATRVDGGVSFRVKLPATSAPPPGTAWHLVVGDRGELSITDDRGKQMPAATEDLGAAASSLGLTPGTYTLSRAVR